MYIHHFKSDLINSMDQMRISGIEPSSVILSQTAHRCVGELKKTFDLRSGSQRHRHFVGFFNVSVQAPTRGQPFHTVIQRNRPI